MEYDWSGAVSFNKLFFFFLPRSRLVFVLHPWCVSATVVALPLCFGSPVLRVNSTDILLCVTIYEASGLRSAFVVCSKFIVIYNK